MQIGELSRRTGISVRMLRYYEEEGVLRPGRRESGYRDYGPAEEQLAKRIRMLSDAGLKLDAIRTLLPCVLSDLPELELCDEVRATLTREICDMDERIACLQSSREVLAGYLGKDTKQKVRIGSTS
jgi:DNA-binding transcriptional MerR regulator